MHFQKRYVIITEIIKDGRFGHGNIRNRDRCGSAAHQLGYHHHLHDAGTKAAALTGASNDSFYDKNRGRTKEARLHKLTTILTVLFFVLILFIDIVMPLITK